MSLDLSSLNPSQIEAVKTSERFTMIIAGPGTGKTLTLAFRIAYLIHEKHISPSSILAITFTNKAAQEMRERISNLLFNVESIAKGQDSEFRNLTHDSQLATHNSRFNIGTFHALGLSILREEGHRIGLSPDFRILSEPEQEEMVKEILSEVMPEEPLSRAKKWARRISEQKNFTFDASSGLPLPSAFPEVLLSAYENRLKAFHRVDFDDLILKPLMLFREDPHLKKKYQNQFSHILVDEYQDINILQYCFLKELCEPYANLWVIGDADQAIYAFRGANVKYFLRFNQDNPQARTLHLEKNYRSTGTILTGALELIKNNPNRIPYNLFPSNPEGRPIYLMQAPDHRAEARFVVQKIEELIGGIRMESSLEDQGMFGFSDIVILYRLHHLSLPFSEMLNESGIPYQVVGSKSDDFDSVSGYLVPFLKMVLNPNDDLSFRTVIPLMDQRLGSKERFLSLLQQFHKDCTSLSLGELIKNIFQELKLKEGTSLSEWLTLTEPLQEGPASEQIPQFLETVLLLKEGETYDPKAEAVTLMTVHAAKGLEFPVVFMVGLEAGIFPCSEFGEEPADLEEERRLFYVGMTRAKKILYFSSAKERFLFGTRHKNSPSLFISEIPPEKIENITDFKKPSRSKKKTRVKQLKLFS